MSIPIEIDALGLQYGAYFVRLFVALVFIKNTKLYFGIKDRMLPVIWGSVSNRNTLKQKKPTLAWVLLL